MAAGKRMALKTGLHHLTFQRRIRWMGCQLDTGWEEEIASPGDEMRSVFCLRRIHIRDQPRYSAIRPHCQPVKSDQWYGLEGITRKYMALRGLDRNDGECSLYRDDVDECAERQVNVQLKCAADSALLSSSRLSLFVSKTHLLASRHFFPLFFQFLSSRYLIILL